MIEFSHISKRFIGKAGIVDALIDVSLRVEKGDIYGIIGFSGAGKSTLIRMVNRLERPDSGTVTVDGQDLSHLSTAELRKVRRNIGMVFQQFNLLESKTVFQNIATPLVLAGTPRDAIAKRVEEVLRFVELEEKRNTYVSQLSGGQKQRVGIARALVTDPDILLCDEATSALDPKTTESILELLKRVNREMGVTILLITHQMQVIQMVCNKVAVMENGRVVEQGGVMDVFSRPQAPVTQEFVRTVINDQIPASVRDLLQTENRHYLLTRLNRDLGITIVVITHEMAVIKKICDRVAVMEYGKVVEEGDVFSVFANPRQPITKDFINTTSNLSEIYNLVEESSPVVYVRPGEILVKIKYLNAMVSEPLITTIAVKFGLAFNILFSDVEIIGNRPLGGTVGIISGWSEDIDKALAYLEEKEIAVEVIKDARSA